MIDEVNDMDYYSGAPEPTDYNFDDNGNVPKGNRFFKNYSFFVLLGIAAVIILFIVIFLFTSKNSAPEYNKKDSNSYLESLVVFGGRLNTSFDSKTFKYEVEATSSNYITFECEVASKKSKVEGCKDSIEVKPGEVVEHNIKVTAEDGNITRYYFKITKSKEETEIIPGGIIGGNV